MSDYLNLAQMTQSCVDGLSGVIATGSKHLSETELDIAREMVIEYLATHGSIANRDFRALTQLSYDQAVVFFNRMLATGHLVRIGKKTTTRYVLPAMK